MGRQVWLLFHGDDYSQVGNYVVGNLGGVIGPRRWTAARPEPIAPQELTVGSVRYLVPTDMVDEIRSFDVRGEWSLDVAGSPAVEWVSYAPFEGEHRPGRFYLEPKFVVSDNWRQKSDAFLRFSEKLFRWVRRLPTVETAWGRVHVGPAAAIALETGSMKVAQGERPRPDEYTMRFDKASDKSD
jgi:hypothetical protein